MAGSFFVTILPQLWLTKFITEYFQKHSLIKLMVLNRLLGGFLVSSLIFFQSLWNLYFFLFFSSFLMSFQLNLQRSFVALIVPKDKLSMTHRRLSSLRAITIMLAPACGGWIMENSNFSFLFFLDALTFLISAYFFFSMRCLNEKEQEKEKEESALASASTKIFSGWHPAILAWCLFLMMGSFHNGAQVPILESVGLSASQIGVVLMFWGVGGFLVLIWPQNLAHFFSINLSILLFTFCLSFYLIGLKLFLACSCMMICGFFYSFIVGELRARISHLAKGKKESLLLWASVGEKSAWLQFCVYLFMMFAFKLFPSQVSSLIVFLLGFSLVCWVSRRGKENL